jgi:ribosomal protein L34
MLLSKRQAIQKFKAETGRSVISSRKAIEKLTGTIEGKRVKYSDWHVGRAILEERRSHDAVPERIPTIRPISDRRAQEIRERCI